MNNSFIKIPLNEIQYHSISVEELVFAYIRSYELSSSFVAENPFTLPIGICVKTEKSVAADLGLEIEHLRIVLKKLQYKHHKGARVMVEVEGRWRKIWCTTMTIQELVKARLI